MYIVLDKILKLVYPLYFWTCDISIPAIILGHLKKNMEELKLALLHMNEDVLTAELIHQLLQYLPDSKEVQIVSAMDLVFKELP